METTYRGRHLAGLLALADALHKRGEPFAEAVARAHGELELGARANRAHANLSVETEHGAQRLRAAGLELDFHDPDHPAKPALVIRS